MKDMLKCFSAVVCIAWSGYLMAQTSSPSIKSERKEANREANNEIKKLLELKDYTSLTNLVKSWKTNLTGTTKESLQVSLFWEIHNSNADRVDFEGPFPLNVTRHDLSILNGRIVWALEQLLGCQFPAMVKASTPDDIQKVRQTVDSHLRIVTQKITSREIAIWAKWVSTLSTADKYRLAKDPEADEYALAELVKDVDVEVRRAAASNPSTPLASLRLLLNDTDDKVKSIADDNLTHARTLNNGDFK